MTTHTGASFGEKVKGTFDLFLMFGRGIKPFEKEGTFRHAMLSLWFIALTAPLNYVAAYLYRPQGLEEEVATYQQVALILTGFGILNLVIGFGFSWLFAKIMDRKDRFWLWFQAGNWLAIPNLVIGIPVLAAAASGHWPREEMNHMMSLVLYYNVLVNGCLTFRALKIGWEMAAFYACMSVMIGQQIYNFMFATQGFTAP